MKTRHPDVKLLQLPDNLPKASITFYPEDWDEFDRLVKWLIDNGVPLEHGHYGEKHLVRMNGKRPLSGGAMLNRDIRNEKPNWVRGEEFNSTYEVFFPEGIR